MSHALMNVLAAATLNMTVLRHNHDGARRSQVKALCHDALRLRGTIMPDHQISIKGILVSLLSASHLLTHDRNSMMGWFYLQEAATSVSLLWAKESSTAKEPSNLDQLHRLYWLVWIHERFNAINCHRKPILKTIDSIPPLDPTLPTQVATGYNYLIKLWRNVDDTFITNWLEHKPPSLTPTWVEHKQSQLGHETDQWEDELKVLSQKQQIDLIVTRHWFRTLVWQMALAGLLLKSGPDTTEGTVNMGFIYPALISRRLRVVLTNTPREAIEVHGTGVVHKAFDIVSTLADLLEHSLHTICDAQTIADYVDDFCFMFTFLTSMPNFQDSERALLQSRHKTLCTMYPQLMS